MARNRDNFSPAVIDAIGRRASFICSNPDCRAQTLAPSTEDPAKSIYIGQVAHITAAAEGGPHYDAALSPEDRSSAENGVFLCATCATMIDKNQGLDYSVELLRAWKSSHEKWVGDHLNKSVSSIVTRVAGRHSARGTGRVTGLDIRKPAIIEPGTVATAEGQGIVTGTRIGGTKEEDE